ncbi:Polyribonucleotide nucleotidyltransferase, partial [Haemophilus influenzae]
NRGFCKPTNQP